jgi:mercuric ion transport protein
MKKLIYLFAIILLSVSCTSGTKKAEATSEAQAISTEHLTQVKFDVKGMTCEGCENAIMTNIKKLEGIQEVSASHASGESVVKFDSTLINSQLISEAISGAGYEVTGFE